MRTSSPQARSSSPQETLPPSIALAFAPLHKRAFGMAVGLATGLLIFLLTILYVVRNPGHGTNLWLLGQYLTGYRVTLAGAFVGFAWGVFIGFIAGWFVAFVRNFAIALSLFLVRAKADMSETRDFLDHI
jgi:hypothetical protein